jgi:FkbM family methyltransferase
MVGAMSPKQRMIRLTERALGYDFTYPLCEALAKIGLRGLGVNIDYEFNRSGEAFFLDRLMRAYPNCRCADIGANIGDYTEALLARGAQRVFAFEPVSATFDTLYRRFKNVPRVQMFKMALGEKEAGTVSIDMPADGRSGLASRGLQHNLEYLSATVVPHAVGETVALRTLDSIVRETDFFPDFVKIDVEGFELEVLDGAGWLIRSCPPRALQFEFGVHHLARKHTLLDFQFRLPKYELFRLATRSLRPLRAEHYLSNVFGYSNVIAVHHSAVPQLVIERNARLGLK